MPDHRPPPLTPQELAAIWLLLSEAVVSASEEQIAELLASTVVSNGMPPETVVLLSAYCVSGMGKLSAYFKAVQRPAFEVIQGGKP
jgi:hypothetical protein